jgi:hypothetical protein
MGDSAAPPFFAFAAADSAFLLRAATGTYGFHPQ